MTTPGQGWGNPVVGGTVLRIPAIESPNFIDGLAGWILRQDGTAQLNELTIVIQSTLNNVAILVYNGDIALGSLIGSWASAPGTDSVGNTFPAGLFANQADFLGVTITAASIAQAIISGGSITSTSIGQSAITGGTVTETVITFDSGGGQLLAYTTTTTTVTQSTNGTYTFTAPAGVTSAKVECWGAGAGANGGDASDGQLGGGGGEYAAEPSYPLIPGNDYTYVVGNGGSGAFTGNLDAQDGGDTFFDNTGVYAHGGDTNHTGGAGNGGAGGTGSVNTVHFNGGTGGKHESAAIAGAGGGGSAGSTGAGGTGVHGSGSSAGAGGAAGTGGGAAGGAGGTATNSGSNGASPGGGGGGSGESSSTTPFSKTYQATGSFSYYGTDIGGGKRNTNGSVYQGTYSGGAGTVGNQFGFWTFPSTIQSDLVGVTISSITLTITNQHSWYNSGMTIAFGYSNRTSFPSSISSLGAGDKNDQIEGTIAETATHTYSLGSSTFGAAFKSGAAKCIMIGPSPTESNLNYYGYFAGGANSATLTITGTSGSSSAPKGGDGADGRVKITYANSQALALAISPAAGTDAAGNAFGAGLTGQVQAFTPGSSPTTVETWHSGTPVNGWVNAGGGLQGLRYKLTAFNAVWLQGVLNSSAMTNTVFFTLPTGYHPSSGSDYPVGGHATTLTTAVFLRVATDGTCTLLNSTTSTGVVEINQLIPLD